MAINGGGEVTIQVRKAKGKMRVIAWNRTASPMTCEDVENLKLARIALDDIIRAAQERLEANDNGD